MMQYLTMVQKLYMYIPHVPPAKSLFKSCNKSVFKSRNSLGIPVLKGKQWKVKDMFCI